MIRKSIIIDDGVFVGALRTILKDPYRKNAIISTDSVVSGIIPESEVWARNPVGFIQRCDKLFYRQFG